MTEGLGGIFQFLGKVVVAVGNTLVAYAVLEGWTEIRDRLNSVLVPLGAVLLVSYIITSVFMSVYSVASIALIQCFLTDLELTKARQGEEVADGKHRPKELDSLVHVLKKK